MISTNNNCNYINSIPPDTKQKRILINTEGSNNSNQNNIIHSNNNNHNSWKQSSVFSNSMPFTSMKRGEHFHKKSKQGRFESHLVNLSQDEKILFLKKTRCSCNSFDTTTKILIDNITKITSETANSGDNPYNYYICISTNEKDYRIYHKNQQVIDTWNTDLNNILKKKNSIANWKKNQKVKQESILIIWQSEIIPKWDEYRDFWVVKNTRQIIMSKKYLNKKGAKPPQYMNSENWNINKEQVIHLWTWGLPSWLRKNMWRIIIGNKLDISESWFNNFAMEIKSKSNPFTVENTHPQFFQTYGNNKTNWALPSNGNIEYTKEIESDIKTICNKFHKPVPSLQYRANKCKEDIYIIIRSLLMYRPDIVYCKPISYIAAVIYLNSWSCFDAFVSSCNFIVPSYLFKFINSDSKSTEEYTKFFLSWLNEYLPDLYIYLQKLQLNINLWFQKWVEYLFVKTFPYEIVLRIWDCFIIKGEIYIFEVALGIMTLLYKEIMLADLSKCWSMWKVVPMEQNTIERNSWKSSSCADSVNFHIYSEEDLFQTIEQVNITKDFYDYFELLIVGKEKGDLFIEM